MGQILARIYQHMRTLLFPVAAVAPGPLVPEALPLAGEDDAQGDDAGIIPLAGSPGGLIKSLRGIDRLLPLQV
ncbi:hypothetical protein FRC09_000399 [Ceratobasidium sp. 395]|nr:hypothetical protein FRC09_000399 [Ceratobasidium sp. 395]